MNDSPGSTSDTRSPFVKKRTAPRYGLVATVEIIEPATDTHFYGRISEIGRKGCYVDSLNTLPQGTFVQMMISRDKGTFMAAGKIVYVHDNMGMGIAFTEVPADQMQVLDSWLEELKG
jgi:hypothetical protein